MRPGDAICANSFVQSFSPKKTRRKRTIKKSKKIISNFVKTLHFHHLSHSTLSYLGKIKFDNTLKFSFFLDGIVDVQLLSFQSEYNLIGALLRNRDQKLGALVQGQGLWSGKIPEQIILAPGLKRPSTKVHAPPGAHSSISFGCNTSKILLEINN